MAFTIADLPAIALCELSHEQAKGGFSGGVRQRHTEI